MHQEHRFRAWAARFAGGAAADCERARQPVRTHRAGKGPTRLTRLSQIQTARADSSPEESCPEARERPGEDEERDGDGMERGEGADSANSRFVESSRKEDVDLACASRDSPIAEDRAPNYDNARRPSGRSVTRERRPTTRVASRWSSEYTPP